MMRAPWRLATLTVAVIAYSTSLVPAQGLQDRSIADRVPEEDPSLRSHAQPTPPPPKPAATGSYLGSAVGATLDAIAWTATGIANIPGGTGQFLWEVSYLLGVNSTPILPPRAAEPPPRPRPVPAATPAPAPPVMEPLRAAARMPEQPAIPPSPTMPIGPQDEVDPGLIANFVYDRSNRREDGSFFVPKPLQRLFNVRTEQARVIDVPDVRQISGRIVPDPSLHGTVQPSVPGRLEPPDTGFPTLGQAVKQGETLAWVSPSIGVVDRSQVRRDVTRLTTDIRLETEALEILRQFTWVPFREGKIYQAEQRLSGLRRERDALLPMLELREALRAPTDGIVSTTSAVNGRIVQPGEVMFEVIDPTRLWIEATASNPAIAEAARGTPVAAATTPEGINLTLRFVGSGLSVARQSTPIMYRIENPPAGLRVGRPVSVTVVNTGQSQRGILLNRSAVTQGSSGVEEVWEQTAAETFVPHPVRTRVIDGTSILVVDGVAAGARIVINGSRLMAQLQ